MFGGRSKDDPVAPPAVAYGEMAHLFDQIGHDYFASKPPESGARLLVIGDDGIPTQWDMSGWWAQRIAKLAKSRSRIQRVSMTDYAGT